MAKAASTQPDSTASLREGGAQKRRDTRPVRPSEQLDWPNLAAYVRERLAAQSIAGFDAAAEMTVEQFPGGHSNLTYLLRFGTSEFVMRRPPLGTVAPRAHDMERECRLLQAVHLVFPLAPRPFVLCEDTSVIGSIFYVMERRSGIVVRDREPPEIIDKPAARRRISASVVDTLARLHNVDVYKHNLDSLGKPSGFVARQVRGWTERWIGSKTSEVDEMSMLARWLTERLPRDPPRFTLVHGDFKLDNVMLNEADVGRVVAVLDWEMCAIGDPLVDLGILLCYWVHTARATVGAGDDTSLDAVTNLPGWFNHDEIIARYAQQTKADLASILFYEIFAVFKLAVVIQQIFYRYHQGQTDDPRFASLDERVQALARVGAALTKRRFAK
ncbi:MAG: phosphotransferase family protein [Pyrinomonadaceae bacterium]|nr:phosphotransferase family protein [Pyrinomonadaceae bacterium]